MRSALVSLVSFFLIVGVAAQPALGESAPNSDAEPQDSGLVERTGRHLIQLDVTVRGPEEAVADLDADDFEVVIDGRLVEDLLVDNLCRTPAEREGESSTAVRDASYLFYFDQPHLTFGGSVRALELTRELVRELITGSNRGMIVSSRAERLTTYTGWTSSQKQLSGSAMAMPSPLPGL